MNATTTDERLIFHPNWCLKGLCEVASREGAHIGVPMAVKAEQDDVMFNVSQGCYPQENRREGESLPELPLVVVNVEHTAGCFEDARCYLSPADALELARTLLAAVVEAQR